MIQQQIKTIEVQNQEVVQSNLTNGQVMFDDNNRIGAFQTYKAKIIMLFQKEFTQI